MTDPVGNNYVAFRQGRDQRAVLSSINITNKAQFWKVITS